MITIVLVSSDQRLLNMFGCYLKLFFLLLTQSFDTFGLLTAGWGSSIAALTQSFGASWKAEPGQPAASGGLNMCKQVSFISSWKLEIVIMQGTTSGWEILRGLTLTRTCPKASNKRDTVPKKLLEVLYQLTKSLVLTVNSCQLSFH